MPRLLPVGQRAGGVALERYPMEQRLAWAQRFQELCPEAYTESGEALVARIELTTDELRALIEDPNGPRIARHFFCRARMGLQP